MVRYWNRNGAHMSYSNMFRWQTQIVKIHVAALQDHCHSWRNQQAMSQKVCWRMQAIYEMWI